MTRTAKTLSWIGAILVILLAAIIIFIATFNWNRLKPTINHRVSEALHRPFAIRGDLGVQWERNKQEPGWRSWVPWPHIHAEDVLLGNPPDIPDITMVHLQRVDATLAPLSLLAKTLYLPWIKLQQPDARVIRLSDKINNWTFDLSNGNDKPASQPSTWSFRLDNIMFDQGRVTINDSVTQAQMEILVDPLGKALPFSQVTGKAKDNVQDAGSYIFGLTLHGQYKDQAISGHGKIGGMLALRNNTPFPVQADMRSGNTRITFEGVISDPMKVGGVDMRLRFAGDTLADLYPLTGVLLPDTPPFETDGHLIAKIDADKGSEFHYRDFNGRIGDSDIHGSLTYHMGKPRPKLTGVMESKQLRLADLGPLIGVDSGTGGQKNRQAEQRRGERTVQPADKVLPYDRFETDKWNVMDANVRFKGGRIEQSSTLPLSHLNTHVILDNGDLRLDPLRFGMAGGTIDASIHLDGRDKPMRGAMDIQARRLQLKQLMPDIPSMQKTLGELNGDANIRGTGNSVAALLGSGNGQLKLLMNDGLVSRNLMEILGLNIGNFIVGTIFGDEEVRINCAAASLTLTNGLVRPDIFAVDTDNAIINVTGNLSLAQEIMDLTVSPESKGIRIITLRSPLYVRGTFKHPDYGVKPGPLILRGAVAAALATLATPAAALLALVSPSQGNDNQCRTILAQMHH